MRTLFVATNSHFGLFLRNYVAQVDDERDHVGQLNDEWHKEGKSRLQCVQYIAWTIELSNFDRCRVTLSYSRHVLSKLHVNRMLYRIE